MNHVPVLLQEVIEYLDPQKGDVVVDATFGFGGHSREILKKIGPTGKLIAVEKDAEVLTLNKSKYTNENLVFVNDDFENISEILENLKIKKVNRILFDFGISSFHLDESGRGFSFQKDEPLDMRLDKAQNYRASDLVNSMSEKELADLLYNLSDEYHSRRIAKAIIEARRKQRITTTGQLKEIVENVVKRSGKTNPATKTFQALRIVTNDELKKIVNAVPKAIDLLAKDGRIAVISFHSGEDRIIKNIFKSLKAEKKIEILTKKPLTAQEQEIKDNPRSRSAKLRVAQRR